MSYLTQTQCVGGNGGTEFKFTGETTGATLKKIWVWVGGWQVKAIKVWLTDGESQQFGSPSGDYKEFEFQDGEHISSLSLWGNEEGYGDRLGAIKFTTNYSNQFFARMTDRSLKTEYQIDVGSGICLGFEGRSGLDIDCLGFVFINTIKSAVLTDVNYTHVTPQIVTEKIQSFTYTNNNSVTQTDTVQTTKMLEKSAWSVTNKMEATFDIEVSAGIPEITGGAFTLGVKGTYGLGNLEKKTEIFSFPVEVPPGKTVVVDVTIGRVTFELPYTGTVEITCHNGSVLRILTKGAYKGVTYTDAKTTVTEK